MRALTLVPRDSNMVTFCVTAPQVGAVWGATPPKAQGTPSDLNHFVRVTNTLCEQGCTRLCRVGRYISSSPFRRWLYAG